MQGRNRLILYMLLITIVVLFSTMPGCGGDSNAVLVESGKAEDIYAQVSPAIVFVDTPAFIGSGIFIEGGYVVTCAHVVWPFDNVTVIFPDGSEFYTSVVNTDLLADLAILGPITADVPTLSLVGKNDLKVGGEVYAIGYPGEGDLYPQPTFSRGIISRLREWETLDLTYIQSDAAGTGGLSGGALLSENGMVLGMIGFSYADVFELAVSATDISSRVRKLIDGEDIDGLGQRQLPSALLGETEHRVTLENPWDAPIFVIDDSWSSNIEIEATGNDDISLMLVDSNGDIIAETSENLDDLILISGENELDAPCFLVVLQNEYSEEEIQLSSNCSLIPFEDVDDGARIEVGDTLLANIDCPRDRDYFELDLETGQTVNIVVDSLLTAPHLTVGYYTANGTEEITDYDVQGGVFGENAELIFTASESGIYYIAVSNYYDEAPGGYLLTVSE